MNVSLENLASQLSAAQNRITKLEQKIIELNTKTARHDGDLAKLNLWHNSRILGHISKIFPKSRSVIFCDGGFFGDNTKYAFLKFIDIAKQKNIECHFMATQPEHRDLLKQNGLPCLPAINEFNLEHYNILLRAKVVVAQDDFTPFTWNPPLPFFFLQGAKIVQLWHGLPIKDIAMLRPAPGGHGINTASTGPADVLVAPGEKDKQNWAHWVAFRDFAPVGYPRNDVMLREPTQNDLINVDMNVLNELKSAKSDGRKVVFYAPTFRDENGLAWLEKSGIADVGQWCRDRGHFLFTKPHPVDKASAKDIVNKISGVCFAEPTSDLYPLMRYVDILITDYSSLAFDFLMLNRPIIFYRPDHAEYVAKCRNLRPDYEHLSPGPIATDSKSLCTLIDTLCLNTQDEWTSSRLSLQKELFTYQDANAAERIAEIILKQLDEPQKLPDSWAP